jgi:hypothetical protein
MGARIFVVSGGLALLAAALVIQACGSTETVTPSADGGGPDVVADKAPVKDTAPPDDDAATCDLSADFTSDIPDAAIADGASTSGLCVQCANSKCAKEVDNCNLDCPCQGLAASALDCYLKNTADPTVCAAGFIGSGIEQSTQNIGIALLTCINSKCKDDCATASFQDAGKDADAN